MIALANRMAPEHLVVDDETTAAAVGRAAPSSSARTPRRSPATTRSGRTTSFRPAGPPGFAADSAPLISCESFGAARDAGGAPAPGADRTDARARRRARRARGIHRSEGSVSEGYNRPAPTGDGLRLHLNENTAGCSPKVLEALASSRPPMSRSTPTTTASTARPRRTRRARGSPAARQRPRRRHPDGDAGRAARRAPDGRSRSSRRDARVRHVCDHRARVRRRGGERGAREDFEFPLDERPRRRSRRAPGWCS